jgi:hypothetical protein
MIKSSLQGDKKKDVYIHIRPTSPPGACPAERVRAGEQQPKRGLFATRYGLSQRATISSRKQVRLEVEIHIYNGNEDNDIRAGL